MGIKLMVEVMDHAPKSLTWREHSIMLVLAENFNDGTRRGWPQYDGASEESARFRARTRCSRGQFYDVLGDLVKKKLIKIEVRGQKGRCAVYSMPRLAPFSVPENRTLNEPEPPAEPLPEGYAEPYPADSQGPGKPDPEGRSVSGSGGFSVRENQTPSPQVPSKLNTLNTSSSELGDPASDPLPDSASTDAPSGDGLRPRGSAAPEEKRNHLDDDLDYLPPVVATELEQMRGKILTMPSGGVTQQLQILAERFPKIYSQSLSHTSSLGIAYDLDTFNREALRYGVQLFLIQKHHAATAA